MQNHHPRASVLETVDGCRDAAAAVDEFIAALEQEISQRLIRPALEPQVKEQQ